MRLPHIYKFLLTKHLDIVLGGSIRVTHDSVFRAMEEKAAAWIGDRLENATEALFDKGIYSSEAINATSPPGRAPLIAAAAGIQVTMHNVSVQYHGAPFYMYAASRGNLERLTRAMCDEAPPEDRRDACVEILNFPELAKIIFQFGRVKINGKDFRMNELFSDVKHGRVIYRPMTIEAGIAMADASPFNKHILFRPQSEVRIAFAPRNSTIPKILDVMIDRPHRFFREVFRDRPPSAR